MSFVHWFEPGDDWTVLALHGTGGNERDLVPLAKSVVPGAAVLSPLGKVREGGAPRWFRRFAEGVFDMDDLQARTHELADWLEAQYGERGIERRRTVAVGYSNGATTAAALMVLRPEVLAFGVLLRPSVPFLPEPMPDLSGSAALLAPGRFDRIVDPAQAETLASVLSEAGARADVAVAEAGHELSRADLEAAASWVTALKAATAGTTPQSV
jgi:phospholipase/carboxylesterase